VTNLDVSSPDKAVVACSTIWPTRSHPSSRRQPRAPTCTTVLQTRRTGALIARDPLAALRGSDEKVLFVAAFVRSDDSFRTFVAEMPDN